MPNRQIYLLHIRQECGFSDNQDHHLPYTQLRGKHTRTHAYTRTHTHTIIHSKNSWSLTAWTKSTMFQCALCNIYILCINTRTSITATSSSCTHLCTHEHTHAQNIRQDGAKKSTSALRFSTIFRIQRWISVSENPIIPHRQIYLLHIRQECGFSENQDHHLPYTQLRGQHTHTCIHMRKYTRTHTPNNLLQILLIFDCRTCQHNIWIYIMQ